MGRKLRVMLICKAAAGGLPGVDSRLPDNYLVVKSAKHVRVRFILVCVDEAVAGIGKESSISRGSGMQHVLTRRLWDAVPVISGGALVMIIDILRDSSVFHRHGSQVLASYQLQLMRALPRACM